MKRADTLARTTKRSPTRAKPPADPHVRAFAEALGRAIARQILRDEQLRRGENEKKGRGGHDSAPSPNTKEIGNAAVTVP